MVTPGRRFRLLNEGAFHRLRGGARPERRAVATFRARGVEGFDCADFALVQEREIRKMSEATGSWQRYKRDDAEEKEK
jgi:hypothetical protein